MKVLQINIFGNLSTGRIATDLYRSLVDSGYDGKHRYFRVLLKRNGAEIPWRNLFDLK